ncbi:hypothetical protein [Prochlorococcus marinus]|uniref:hypothetical protein n=1 Tax=Prochlorococcus marinus TaxID=1219 RepID=UPI0012DA501A|nr:hypothetical protein [Prochlorococcus marinus]
MPPAPAIARPLHGWLPSPLRPTTHTPMGGSAIQEILSTCVKCSYAGLQSL